MSKKHRNHDDAYRFDGNNERLHLHSLCIQSNRRVDQLVCNCNRYAQRTIDDMNWIRFQYYPLTVWLSFPSFLSCAPWPARLLQNIVFISKISGWLSCDNTGNIMSLYRRNKNMIKNKFNRWMERYRSHTCIYSCDSRNYRSSIGSKQNDRSMNGHFVRMHDNSQFHLNSDSIISIDVVISVWWASGHANHDQGKPLCASLSILQFTCAVETCAHGVALQCKGSCIWSFDDRHHSIAIRRTKNFLDC